MRAGAPSQSAPTTGVRTAIGALRQEVVRLGFLLLLVGSGLWVLAAACAERFVADLATALQARGALSRGSTDRPRVYRAAERIPGRLSDAIRRCEPALVGWHRLAVRWDRKLLERLPLGRR